MSTCDAHPIFVNHDMRQEKVCDIDEIILIILCQKYGHCFLDLLQKCQSRLLQMTTMPRKSIISLEDMKKAMPKNHTSLSQSSKSLEADILSLPQQFNFDEKQCSSVRSAVPGSKATTLKENNNSSLMGRDQHPHPVQVVHRAPHINNNQQNHQVVHNIVVTHDSGFDSGDHSLQIDPEDSSFILERNARELDIGCFYHKSIDQASAMKLLKRAKVGSFLVRASSHQGYLFSVSVKSEQGATSVRVSYADGLFGFDGDEEQPNVKPRFDTLVSLLDYYALRNKDGKCLTMRGKSDRKPVKISFTTPIRNSVPSLAHLARVKINGSISRDNLHELSLRALPKLSDKDRQFVRDYRYSL